MNRAELIGADLSRAVLCEANLSGINLQRAMLRAAVLRGARTHFLYLEPEWSPLPEDGGGEEGGDA